MPIFILESARNNNNNNNNKTIYIYTGRNVSTLLDYVITIALIAWVCAMSKSRQVLNMRRSMSSMSRINRELVVRLSRRRSHKVRSIAELHKQRAPGPLLRAPGPGFLPSYLRKKHT